MVIKVNYFASNRHFSDKGYSYFTGSEQELIEMCEKHFESKKPGYREGVFLISLPTTGFKSGVVEVTETTQLETSFKARRKGESPYIQIKAKGESLDAKVVDIVIYSREVLGSDATEAGSDFEVVSINARPTLDEEPQHPVSMARNQLGIAGGTKASYSAEDFANSIRYWSSRAMKA